ncbi:MAG: DUF3237 domain-containing protein [Acetobacteraceae bacterium]
MTSMELQPALAIHARVAAPISLGRSSAGERRIVPITDGVVTGRVAGRILPGGMDDQLVESDGLTRLIARYVIESADGALIHVENHGMRHGPAELMERLRRDEPVDPSSIYFRCAPRFHTIAEPHLWLTRALFVGTGVRRPDHVELTIFEVR